MQPIFLTGSYLLGACLFERLAKLRGHYLACRVYKVIAQSAEKGIKLLYSPQGPFAIGWIGIPTLELDYFCVNSERRPL